MIPCAVTVLYSIFTCFFISLVDWIRIAPLSVRPITFPGHAGNVLTFEVAQVTPLQCPIHLPHDNTHIIHCIVISPASSRLCTVPSLSLAEFVTPWSMVDKVAISPPKMRWLDKGGVQPKLSHTLFYCLESYAAPLCPHTIPCHDRPKPPTLLSN
jgi:hypothetical protein